MSTEMLNQTITLTDGRTLGFAYSGDTGGEPLFLFHGLSSSRYEVNIIHEQMLKAGIWVIGVDRPGIGLSTFQENRTILDFVDDVLFLSETLKIKRFSIMAISAGAAYAYACVYKIPQHIISCNIISGIAPVFELGDKEMSKKGKLTIRIAQKAPWLMHPVFWYSQGRFSKDDAKSDIFLANIMDKFDDVDKVLLKDEMIKGKLLKSFQESFKQGSKGVAYDGILAFAKAWNFTLDEISFSPITLWHGEKDKGVPVVMAQKVSDKLEHAKLIVFPNEGHLSIVFNEFEKIINTVLHNIGKSS